MFKEPGTYTHLIQVQEIQGLREKDEKKIVYLRWFSPAKNPPTLIYVSVWRQV